MISRPLPVPAALKPTSAAPLPGVAARLVGGKGAPAGVTYSVSESSPDPPH